MREFVIFGDSTCDLSRELREKFDIEYVKRITFKKDIEIIWLSAKKMIMRSDIAEDTNAVEGNFAEIRREKAEKK